MRRITSLAGACLCAAIMAAPTAALSQDATWRATGADGQYSTASNWTPAFVPVGAATFGASTATSVTFSGQINIGAFIFTPDAPAYTFNAGPGFPLLTSSVRFNGSGIVNNSSNAQTFSNPFGSTTFAERSGAGNAIFILSRDPFNPSLNGSLNFIGNSTAANATITNTSASSAGLSFSGSATAGNATIVTNANAHTVFSSSASGGNAVITTNQGGETRFEGLSSAGNATVITNSGGTLNFAGTATAGNANLVNNRGAINFGGSSTAGSANIANTGGIVTFSVSAGNSTISNTSSGQLNLNSRLNDQARVIADSTSQVTVNRGFGFFGLASIGSIEGAGRFLVAGFGTLEVGGNNLSTEVSGTITSTVSTILRKVGTGTLTLSGRMH